MGVKKERYEHRACTVHGEADGPVWDPADPVAPPAASCRSGSPIQSPAMLDLRDPPRARQHFLVFCFSFAALVLTGWSVITLVVDGNWAAGVILAIPIYLCVYCAWTNLDPMSDRGLLPRR